MMNCQATRSDVERFRAAVTRRIGLHFDEAKQGFLGEVLGRRLGKLGRASEPYLWSLEQEPWGREWSALAQELTVGETYFFRNKEQFRALAEIALPERLARAAEAPRRLRLLSAGCASGEEAYSMAIVTRSVVTIAAQEVSIHAVDINPAVLEKAARGRYSAWALRDTPADVLRLWFRQDDREMILDERVRAAVTFAAANIAADDRDLWQPGAYDIVFCRNVLMYFSAEQMRATVARMARSLAPGGFLFLGHAETLRGMSEAFHLRHTHGTFYYERRGDVVEAPPMMRVPTSVVATPTISLDNNWFETINRATERIAMLMPLPEGTPALPPAPRWDSAPALDLLRRERFADALDYVRACPAERDTDVMLLEATLLAHDGQLGAAEEACTRLLAIDDLNAGAYYVLALCREQSGNRDNAGEQDRIAAYLDPGFAMPRLHLGLMARRAGDGNAARRELGHALILLRREEPSRLLLFGGGFSREALIALCEAALRDNGRRS